MAHKKRYPKKVEKKKPKYWVIILVVLAASILLLVKNQAGKPEVPITSKPPEVQLDTHLEESRPVFVFFHSNNCQSCIDMIHVVEQVYPQFQEQVALVDVNVYDKQNTDLLRRANITYIPTQMFIDSSGQSEQTIGVMSPQELQEQLLKIARVSE